MPATYDQVVQMIVAEAKARKHSRDDCWAELSTLDQESELDETVWGPAGKKITFGVAQQDGSYPHRFEGAAAQVKGFFDKLDQWRAKPGASGNIWWDIAWMQQAPNWPSAQYWYDNGRRAYLDEIKSQYDDMKPYIDKYWPLEGEDNVADGPRPDFNIYDNLTINSSSRQGAVPDLLLLHTQEGGGGDDAADDLSQFIKSTENSSNPVSYHRLFSQASDGGVTIVNTVPVDRYSWSVGNSNKRSINYCFAGSRTAWTREQWMQQSKAIDAAAYWAVQDCRRFGIPIKVLWPYGPPGGIADHNYCSVYLKDGNNHTDVGFGLGFPVDYFAARVAYWQNPDAGNGTPPPVVTPPAQKDPIAEHEAFLANARERDLLVWIARQLGPGDPLWASKGKTLRDEVFGL